MKGKKLLIEFGNHLRSLRKRNNLSIESIGIKADVEINQIYRIEQELINPPLSTLNIIADSLGISHARTYGL